jgi:hypothetical protein
VLAGVAGVGKTRLAVEAVAPAERHGFAAVRATATNTARGIPFGAVATFLPLSTRSPAVNDRAAMIQRMSRAGSSAWHPGARPCWSTMPTSSIREGIHQILYSPRGRSPWRGSRSAAESYSVATQ